VSERTWIGERGLRLRSRLADMLLFGGLIRPNLAARGSGLRRGGRGSLVGGLLLGMLTGQDSDVARRGHRLGLDGGTVAVAALAATTSAAASSAPGGLLGSTRLDRAVQQHQAAAVAVLARLRKRLEEPGADPLA